MTSWEENVLQILAFAHLIDKSACVVHYRASCPTFDTIDHKDS